ncbi:hypothetical protein DAEQUDRAFT_733533 [Daedalea quercina L-15889]|uniref:N-acetyltransferase domain-containing protein n=1 Tax=Daedalea quercina L-15889 TaxID=1314783 RepID=A0A165KX53_9APHY|nr:hypothetical protein DAEQUDRAFT_733533 [Daedalea quercina L-15889]
MPSPPDRLVDDAVELFTSIMQNDNATVSLVGGDKSLVGLMIRSMIKAALHAAGEFYPALDANDKLVGYALWMPPGRDLFDTPEQRELGLNEFMKSLPEAGKQYYKDVYMKEFPTFVIECMGNPKGKTDAWWLHNLFVRPDRRRQGIGRKLIEAVKQQAREKGQTLACSTTQDDNALVYRSYGFEQKGVKRMPSPWGDWPLYVFALDTSASA